MDSVFRALSDPNRRKILRLLRKGDMTVTEILGSTETGGIAHRSAVDVSYAPFPGISVEADVEARLGTLLAFVETVERAAADGQAALDARLRERLAALPADLQLDPAAVTQEVVRFVARSDIHEEISRMRGHVEHWRQLAAGPEPCGRKLDFLVQEMNREINTIGSKAEGLKATELVVGAKAELERVREQVQNVE